MSRLKDETLSIRTSAEVKLLLKAAAEREYRSIASMMEVMIRSYAREHGLVVGAESERAEVRNASRGTN